MKEIDIKEVLIRHHITYEHHKSICATIRPSIAAYQNGIKETMHIMKDHILHFNHDGIAIMALHDINGTIVDDTFLFLSNDRILSIRLKVNLFTFLLKIETNDGVISYKIRKSMLAAPWHKENLSFLMLHQIVK